MVEKIVNVEIVGIDDGEKLELKTTGKYIKRTDSEYLEYIDESNVRNHIKIEQDAIYLTKYTNPPTNMIFKKNENYETKYQTPFGNMDLRINTEKLEIFQEGYDYKIYIKYELYICGEKMNKELTILIK